MSSELVLLCRSQIAILTQGLGASLGVVYVAQDSIEKENTKLIPIAAYPEHPTAWQEEIIALQSLSQVRQLLLPPEESLPQLPGKAEPVAKETCESPRSGKQYQTRQKWQQPSRLVLPLVHDDTVLGLLVTAREDRAWTARERTQIERIAETLAIACILDQQAQWSGQKLRQLSALQAQQRNILDNLLHQLRNPLTAVRTFGKLLLKRLQPTDANRGVAEHIIRESDRLSELLQRFDEVIDCIEQEEEQTLFETRPSQSIHPPIALLPEPNSLGNQALSLTACQLEEILSPLIDSAHAIAQERHLQLETEIPDHLPLIQAHEPSLREVLSNIIDNALKYTPAGGRVWIQVQVNAEQVAIAVSDTGYGIPPADLEQIFERHYRGVQAQSDIPGTGLGLAIAKDLVEQMQGEITAFSPAIYPPDSHKGTTFIVKLAFAHPGNSLQSRL